MTDDKRAPDPTKFATLLPPGSAILLRHYRDPKRNQLAKELRSICDNHSLSLIIADDFELAMNVKADGFHLPEYRLKSPSTDIFKWRRTNNVILTAATHSSQTILKAIRLQVDAVFLSPIFRSPSHPRERPLGLMRFSNMCSTTKLPIYALGGVNDITARNLNGSGAAGIAAIGAIIGAGEEKS